MDFEIDQAAMAHVRETLWDNFWTQGGFGMYPTTFWGFLLLLYAGLYVLRPQERFLRAVAILAFMTLASGTLRNRHRLHDRLSICRHGGAGARGQIGLLRLGEVASRRGAGPHAGDRSAGCITGAGLRRQALQRVTA